MENKELQGGLLDLLRIDLRDHSVIAVVGGGGKTSLIHCLREELVTAGKKVVITTTTHMAYEPDSPFVRIGKGEEALGPKVQSKCRELLANHHYMIVADYEPETGKYSAISEAAIRQLAHFCDAILVEADGSRHRTVKIPAEWEPVIPECADLVIGVIGLDCLGKSIEQCAFRQELTAGFLGKSETDKITEEDIVRIASSAEGLKKNVGNREYRVYLNKTDTLKSGRNPENLLRKLREQKIIASAGSLRSFGGTVQI